LDAARDSIVRAERSGARQYAAAELDEAREKLSLAENLAGKENMLQAERRATESQTVAQLAAALSESAKAAEINRELRRSEDALLEEMRRKGDQQ
jgi:hypothetical protein